MSQEGAAMDGPTDQAIEVLRRSDADYKAKVLEATNLRQRLAETQVELDKNRQLLKKAENRANVLSDDNTKKQHSLDILLKELTAKKQMIEHLTMENKRMKRELETSSRYSLEMAAAMKSKDTNTGELVRQHDSPSALYMSYSFASGADPHMDILRSLHDSSGSGLIDFASGTPANYQQLNALTDIFRMRDSVNTDRWPEFTSLNAAVDSSESFHIVADLITMIPTLTSVSLHGLEDNIIPAVRAALEAADYVSELALPNLRVTDAGFQQLMKVINNREVLGTQGRGKIMIVRELDVSSANLTDTNSFGVIRGTCISSLNLSGCKTLLDKHLGEIIRSCPALTSLSCAYCTGLTNDTPMFINAASNIQTVDLLGCTGITQLKLTHVETLRTDLQGATFFECQELRRIVTPVTNFQVISWSTPKIEELTLQKLSLTIREFEMLSECSNLTHLSFVSCRVASLSTLLRKMRKLIKLSLHSCSGVTDADINNICSTVEVLDLTDNFCLTDKSMLKIGEFCRNLSHLTLKRCSNVTDKGVLALGQIQGLEYLNALGAKRVSVVALQRLVTLIPALEQVVHESLIAANVRVEREDAEETQRLSLKASEQEIVAAQNLLGLNYVANSPTRTPRKPTATPSKTPNPRAESAAAAAESNDAEPAENKEESAPAAAEEQTAQEAPPQGPPEDVSATAPL